MTEQVTGYAAAIGCALTWAIYSVLNRRYGQAQTAAVGLFCGVAALLALPLHIGLEATVWPVDALGWLVIIAMGVGPMGLAFFLWDYGTKHGDLRLLGTLSYAAPVLSTLILIVAGKVTPTPYVALAVLLVVGGAVFAGQRRRTVNV
jgi:drug/metabolite transporter (DMT)-like permease